MDESLSNITLRRIFDGMVQDPLFHDEFVHYRNVVFSSKHIIKAQIKEGKLFVWIIHPIYGSVDDTSFNLSDYKVRISDENDADNIDALRKDIEKYITFFSKF